jgi:hypothetical protein
MLVKQTLSVWAALSLLALAFSAAAVETQVADLTLGRAGFADGEAIPLRVFARGR